MASIVLPWSFGIAIACSAAPCVAHDFWLQPDAYRVPADAPTAFTLQVGHGPYRQRSPIASARILRFDAIAPDGTVVDLRSELRLGGAAADGAFRLSEAGTSILVLRTDDRAQSHLPAIRFNDYLETEGLTPAIDERMRRQRSGADGSERYGRCAKTLVRVDTSPSDPIDRSTIPVGLPLEIVPDVNPYEGSRRLTLPVHVNYFGHALEGALVKLTDLGNDASPVEVHRTDADGRATFKMPGEGAWLLNVIWTRPSPPEDETDFETVFSSLSFGVPSEPG
jgi:uncharacterized GH25 family protein